MAQPFYHLRPNKYVDRCLFVAALDRLNTKIQLKEYRYIGFGSFMFDDFKLLHDRLNINSMISLEADPTVRERAEYNMPYNCIRIVNQTSTNFISVGEWNGEKSIIWLDYTSPAELAQQFNDVAALSNLLNTNDIVRITLNANVASLGKCDAYQDLQAFRLNVLQERIGEHIPADVHKEELTTANYPILLLRCIHKMLGSLFKENKFDKRFVLPLFSTIYQDGQTMLTFTFIVLDNHDKETEIRNSFDDNISFVNFEWDKPSKIKIPELTVKEILEMNKLLPSENAQEQLEKKFSFVFSGDDGNEKIKSYANFYKFYPSYHSINL